MASEAGTDEMEAVAVGIETDIGTEVLNAGTDDGEVGTESLEVGWTVDEIGDEFFAEDELSTAKEEGGEELGSKDEVCKVTETV